MNVDKCHSGLHDFRVRVTTKPGVAKPFRLAPDLSVQVPAEVQGNVDDLHVSLTIDVVGGRLGCTRVEVRAPSGEVVTGTVLRSIPVASIVRTAAASLVWQTVSRHGDYVTNAPYQPPADFDSSAGPTDEALRFVAAAYSLAYILGEPPAKAVERDLGLATSTAGRWIRLARERGHLDISAAQGRKA